CPAKPVRCLSKACQSRCDSPHRRVSILAADEPTCVAGGQHVADEFRHRWLYQKSPANPLRLLQAVSLACALAIAAPKIYCFSIQSVLSFRHQKPELFDETGCSLSASLDHRANHGQPGT